MKYMRSTAGYTLTDYKTNTQTAKELKITPILDKLLEYNSNWIQHVNRMPRNRLPTILKHYSPTGRRNHGRPLKRLLDTRYMMMTNNCCIPLVFHAYINEMHCSRSKIPSKILFRQRCAEGFNSGVKGLKCSNFITFT
jgi:hypothetical protein